MHLPRLHRSGQIAMLFAFAVMLCCPQTAVAQIEPPSDVLAAQRQRIDVIRKASAATVAIFAPGGRGGGSGVVISADGYALTNFHVAKTGPALECGLPGGHVYDAVIVGIDPTGDVALIQLFGRDDFPHVELGDSDALRAGDWVIVAGNPFLLADDFQPTISYGIVSGVHRYQYPSGTLLEYADCIQTDAAINPGNSGGPLFNTEGQLVGINGRGSFEKRGRVNVGVGYAISINQIKKFLGHLKSGRIVDHATLGATFQLDEEGRVVVEDILDASDAFRRGLRYGDALVRFAGREIGTVNMYKNIVGTFPKGWRAPMTYRREGKTYDCLVRLAGAHREGELAKLAEKKPPNPIEGPKPEKRPVPGEIPQHEKAPKIPIKIPKLPNPFKKLAPPKGEQLPKAVRDHYESRRGYVNYFYNRQNLTRLWEALARQCDFHGSNYQWTIEGIAPESGGKLRIDLSRDHATMEIVPGGRFETRYAPGIGLIEWLDPPGTGGLFAALHLWQRFLIEGPDTFGEVYYLGTMPIPTQDAWADVLIGTYAGIETHFYFDRTSGHLLGLEMFADPDWDPCELYFADYRPVGDRLLPFRWEVRYGDRVYAIFEMESYRFDESTAETAGTES